MSLTRSYRTLMPLSVRVLSQLGWNHHGTSPLSMQAPSLVFFHCPVLRPQA